MGRPSHSGKVVIVGDGAIGKTYLLTSLLQDSNDGDKKGIDWDDQQYIPTAATNLQANWEYVHHGAIQDFNLEVWDTAGQEALKSLRQMSYPDTDIFMLGYDMTRRNTLENVVGHDLKDLESYKRPEFEEDEEDESEVESWITELVSGCKSDFHIILIGTKADYWEELMNGDDEDKKANLTTWQEGYDVAVAIGAKAFIQTSAKTYQGIRKKEADNPGGPPDKQVDPQGQYLKDMICHLRVQGNDNQEVPVVKKIEVAKPAPAKSAPEPAKSAPETAKSAPEPAKSAPEPAKSASAKTTGGPKQKDGSDGGCCTLL
jgi:small GTP-binding protein